MKKIAEIFRTAVTTILIVVYISNVFIQNPALNYITYIAVGILIFLSFPYIDIPNRIVSAILFAAATIMLFLSGADITVYLKGIGKNSGLLVLFILVPVLGIPFRYDKYQDALQEFYDRRIKTRSGFYLFSSFLSHFLGSLINVASLPIIKEITVASEDKRNRNLLMKAVIRGNTVGLLWSPSFLSIALIVDMMNLSWNEIFPIGFSLAVIIILTGWGLEFMKEGSSFSSSLIRKGSSNSQQGPSGYLLELIAVSAVFFSAVILLNQKTPYTVLTIVPILSIVFPLLWAAVFKRMHFYTTNVREYFSRKLLESKNQLVLFGIAGYLGVAIQNTSFSGYIVKLFDNNLLTGQFFGGFFLVLVISASAMVGLHPLVSVTTLISALTPPPAGLDPLFIAMCLLVGYTAAVIISPFSATVLITSGLYDNLPFKTGFGKNWLFCLVSSVVSVIFISVLF